MTARYAAFVSTAFAVLALVLSPLAQASPFRLIGNVRPHDRAWARAASKNIPMPSGAVWIGIGGDPEFDANLDFGDPLALRPEIGTITEPRPGDSGYWTYHALHGDFIHELGHAFDYANGTPAMREQFKALAQTTCKWWAAHCWTHRYWTSPTELVDVPPGEMFAEEYAARGLGLTRWDVEQQGFFSYGWQPPDGAEPTMCALIRSFG